MTGSLNSGISGGINENRMNAAPTTANTAIPTFSSFSNLFNFIIKKSTANAAAMPIKNDNIFRKGIFLPIIQL